MANTNPISLPPIGSLVAIQARGVYSPYYALVTGHPSRLGSRGDPVVEVSSHEFGGHPYHVYLEYVTVVER